MEKLNLEQIALELEDLVGKKRKDSLPTPLQLYNIGHVMFRIGKRKKLHVEESNLLAAYKDFMESLPESYLKQLFQMYQTALSKLFLSKSTHENEGSRNHHQHQAIETLCGLFGHSPYSCQIVYSKDFIKTLATIYDQYIMEAHDIEKDDILSLLSCLLLDGLLSVSSSSSILDSKMKQSYGGPIEEEVMNAIQVMEEQSLDCLRDLQQWQAQSETLANTLESSIKELPFDEDTIHQREYLLNMLESARTSETTKHEYSSTTSMPKKSAKKVHPKTTNVSASDELERRIQQVKQIIPDAGEGFIETALSLFQGDIERTVSTLLASDPSEYPPALRFLDRKLPRRKKERSQDEALEAKEARELVKERVAIEEKQEQERYRALLYVTAQENQEQEQPQFMANEYDDDYDDQYDEIDVKLGDTDNGLYDYEQIKIYNKVAREEEAEDLFWEANRNTNRLANKKEAGGDEVKQYRGPDKIKGGRIVGPDGRIVRKQGPGKKRNKQNNSGQQQASQQSEDAANKNNANGKPGGKPKTKPRSNNRVNRQRDRKQKAQGTFGVA